MNKKEKVFYEFEKIIKAKCEKNLKYSKEYLPYMFKDIVKHTGLNHSVFKKHFDLIYK